MISLCYISTAVEPMSDESLNDILKTARAVNAQSDITGMLLYKDMSFLQVLEGESSVVKALYKKIEQDQRHTDVFTVFLEKIFTREFANWSMAFRNLDGENMDNVEGYTQFMETGEPFARDFFNELTPAKRTLLFFRMAS